MPVHGCGRWPPRILMIRTRDWARWPAIQIGGFDLGPTRDSSASRSRPSSAFTNRLVETRNCSAIARTPTSIDRHSAGRGVPLRDQGLLPSIQRPVEIAVPLDDPDVVARLHIRDA